LVQCDHCSDEVNYLPFTCRYCGKSYCKKHRIPENHECSFEFKNDPYKVRSREEPKPSKIYADYPAESQPRQDTPRRARVRMPRLRDRTNRTRPQVTSLLGMQAKPYGTYGLMIANIVFFTVAIILNSIPTVGIDYVYLSISDYVGNFNYWTFFTSIFLPDYPSITFFGIFRLAIKVLMLFLIGRMIETRWGWKTLIKIYILSGVLTSVGILIIQLISSLFVPSYGLIPFYSSWGAYLGLITFIALLFPQRQVTMFLYFIPIRVKMKNLVWIFTGMSALFGLINVIAIFLGKSLGVSFPLHFGSVAGALGGLIINRIFRRNS